MLAKKSFTTVNIACFLLYFFRMKKVVLIFPDTEMMTDFIFSNKVFQAEVDSMEISLTAFLSDNETAKACNSYKAMLLTPLVEL